MARDIKISQNQITSGCRSILSRPWVYDFFQNIMGAKFYRKFFADQYIRAKSGDRILDMGCGTAQILDFLPDGVEYWGYDISAEYVSAAAKRFGNRGHFACKELTKEETRRLPKFDIVLASGIIHHLDDSQVDVFLHLASSSLRAGGRLVAMDPCVSPDQNAIARFLVVHDRGRHVRSESQYLCLASSVFKEVRGVVRHNAWIPYSHWIMECLV